MVLMPVAPTIFSSPLPSSIYMRHLSLHLRSWICPPFVPDPSPGTCSLSCSMASSLGSLSCSLKATFVTVSSQRANYSPGLTVLLGSRITLSLLHYSIFYCVLIIFYSETRALHIFGKLSSMEPQSLPFGLKGRHCLMNRKVLWNWGSTFIVLLPKVFGYSRHCLLTACPAAS